MELQASNLAKSTLEDARAHNFATLETTFQSEQTKAVEIEGISYNQSVVVTSPGSLTKAVRVTLNWEWKNKNYELFREIIVCRIPRA